MLDHVTLRVADRDASEAFYRTVLAVLDIRVTSRGERFVEWHDFGIAPATAERPRTIGLHVGFVAPSRDHVDEFWRVGTAAGYRDDGEPGPRPQYSDAYYGSFLLDPDGNSAEAVHQDELRRGGVVDHLWIRVADLDASTRFYEAVAPHGGFRPVTRRAERTVFSSGNGRFVVVHDERPVTANLHMAFGAGDDAAVDAFSAALTAAGYRSAGEPGERPEYHAGYYAAYVLDPDGNSVELVCHNRGLSGPS